MALIEGLTGSAPLAVGFFLVFVFAHYAKIKDSAPKGFAFLAAGAVFLLLQATTALGSTALVSAVAGLDGVFSALNLLWTVLAWVLVLVGTLFVAKELVTQ